MDNELLNLGLSITLDYITDEEEKLLLSNIAPTGCKKTKSRNSIRRFGPNVPYKGNLISRSIPDYFDFILKRLVNDNYAHKLSESITINEYQQGQEISPHIDNHASGDTITILSLLSDATMVFEYKKMKKSLHIPAKSLIQMKNEIRYIWTHSILPVESLRYSIVFRCCD